MLTNEMLADDLTNMLSKYPAGRQLGDPPVPQESVPMQGVMLGNNSMI